MRILQRKIEKMEAALGRQARSLPQHERNQLIYLGDPDWKPKMGQIRERLLEEYGSVEGVIFLTHNIPEPYPLPEDHR